jgi:hypothetical protein
VRTFSDWLLRSFGCVEKTFADPELAEDMETTPEQLLRAARALKVVGQASRDIVAVRAMRELPKSSGCTVLRLRLVIITVESVCRAFAGSRCAIGVRGF